MPPPTRSICTTSNKVKLSTNNSGSGLDWIDVVSVHTRVEVKKHMWGELRELVPDVDDPRNADKLKSIISRVEEKVFKKEADEEDYIRRIQQNLALVIAKIAHL